MSLIDDLVDKVQVLSLDKNYWFVRTSSGDFFDTFVNNNFIGIGWNEITYADLTKKDDFEIRQKISRVNKIDLNTSKGKSKVSNIHNKLKAFINLKKGDLIIIPSRSSSRLAFGEIKEDSIFIDDKNSNDCLYHKRREINWITTKTTTRLNPIFYQIKKSRHSISSVNKYQSYIDAVTNDIFFKDDSTHLIVDIKKQQDINIIALTGFLSGIHNLSSEINSKMNFNENIDGASIKLSLNSPGKIEFIYPRGRALVLAITLLSIYNCTDPENHPKNKGEVKILYEDNKSKLDSIDKKLLSLEAEKFNDIN